MSLLGRYQGLSDPLRAERMVELVVLVLLGLLVLQLLWGGYRALVPSIPESVRPARDSLSVSEISGLAVVSPEQRAQIRQRPLFWASRAPLPPAEPVKAKPDPDAAKAAKPGKIENVKLAGVFGAAETVGIIIISKGKKRRVMVGEEINGWTLQAVGETSADFNASGKQASLALKRGEIQVSEVAQSEATDDNNADGADKESKSTNKRKAAKKKERPDTLGLGGGDRNRE